MHPVYKKYIKSSSKYRAHDEANAHQEGDRVSIIECRPISKSKRWTVVTGDEATAKKPAPKKEAAKKAEAKKPVAKKEAAKKTKSTKKDA